MNRVEETFKPFEALTGGTGKIFKTKVNGVETFVRSKGLFSRVKFLRTPRASGADLKNLYEKVKSLRSEKDVDSQKVEETFAKHLNLFSSDSSLKEAAQQIRDEETKALESELAKIKESQKDGLDSESVSSVFRARSWLESLNEPSDLESKLRDLIDDIGLEIARQFTKASFKAENEFKRSPTPAKAKKLLRDPLVGKVSKWGEPFTSSILKKVIALSQKKITPPARPTAAKPSVLSRWQPHAKAEPTGPKPKPKTPPPTLRPKPKPARPPRRSISNPRIKLDLDYLPKAPQPRLLISAPIATPGPCPSKFLSKADALQKNSVFRGKPTLTKEQAGQLTKYFEENKEGLIKLAKGSDNQSVFIARQVSGLPRSIQISIEDDDPKFYILLKSGTSGRKDKIGILGKGGNKTVKLALDYGANELVATASIASGKDAFEEYAKLRLFNSALAACRYVNANQKDVTTIVFPLANRGDMSLEKFDKLTPKQKKQWCLSTASVLQKIHSSGYVSSDVKPENLLLHVDSKGNAHAIMTDHGATVEQGGRFKEGTKPYLPAEMTIDNKAMTKHKMHPAQDIWALGITLWKLTHGNKAPPWHPDRPFKYETRWDKAATTTPLEDLCKAMVNPDPSQRPDIETVTEELAKLEF